MICTTILLATLTIILVKDTKKNDDLFLVYVTESNSWSIVNEGDCNCHSYITMENVPNWWQPWINSQGRLNLRQLVDIIKIKTFLSFLKHCILNAFAEFKLISFPLLNWRWGSELVSGGKL